MGAPVYREEGHLVGKELIDRCNDQMRDVVECCKTSIRIKRGSSLAGFGVDQAKKNLAIDQLILTLKALRTSVKGW